MRQIRHLMLSFLFMVALLLGCEDDGPTGARVSENPGTATRNALVESYALALKDLDFALYSSLLHDDYAFQFQTTEFDLAETASGRWDLARDLLSMERLMSGQPSKDGEVVQSIDAEFTAGPDPWDPLVEPEFSGSCRRNYTSRIDVAVSGGTTYQVRGVLEFYVIEDDDGWKIRFLRDHGVDLTRSSTGQSSMGSIKAAY